MPDRISEAEELIRSEMAYWKVPGMTVTVTKTGCIPYIKSFGVRDADRNPVDTSTLFCIASCTKAMTSAVTAILASKGLIDYDTPVTEYLPAFRLYDSVATSKTTLRDILCHRTGLGGHDAIWPSDDSSSEFISRLQYLEPSAPFRTKAQYSNIMYAVCGCILEAVTDMKWNDILRTYLFEPLGMKSSVCTYEGLLSSENHAEPFRVIRNRLRQVPIWNVDTVAPAASVSTNGEDMALWLSFLTSGGVTSSGKRLISQEIFDDMISGHVSFPDDIEYMNLYPSDMYAYGWLTGNYRGHRLLKHMGKIEGYSSIHAFLPDDGIGISMMLNLHSPALALTHTLMYTFADILTGSTRIDWKHRFRSDSGPDPDEYRDCILDLFSERYHDIDPVSGIPGLQAVQYCGKYTNPGYGELVITENDGMLYMNYRDTCLPLVPYGDDLFRADGFLSDIITMTLPVKFVRGEDGRVESVNAAFEPLVNDISFLLLQK